MLTILQLIAILVVGYLSTHFLFGKLQSKFFFTSGIEYIILGLLAGPQVTNLMTPEVVAQLSPVMSLALGSVGLLYGIQFRIRLGSQTDPESYRVGIIEALTTFLLVAGSFVFVFWMLLSGAERPLAVFSGALVLGATASVSAPNAISVITRHYEPSGKLQELLKALVGFDQLVGMVFFGLAFCLLHVGQTKGLAVTRTEWVVINIAFGILLGLLFFLFLGREKSKQKLTLALIGVVIFSSGAAYYLNLSPLFMNLVLGIVLAITSSIRDRMHEIMTSLERPLYVVMLIFAGAAWKPRFDYPWEIVAGLSAVYVLMRCLGKLAGGYFAHKTAESPELVKRRLGLGLLSQGAVAVAMIINYQQVYQNELTNLVSTCVLASVIFNEFFSQKLARDLLVDAGEIAPA